MDNPAKFFGKRFLVFLVLVLFLIAVLLPQVTQAAALTALSDTMSRLADSTPVAVYSDHAIRFTTPSGATDASDTIEITMPDSFTIGSVDYTDIDLHWGAGTGLENSATLAGTADATHWGAYFTGQILSLDHASDGAFEDIPLTSKIVVEIGQNATGGGANLQIQNHATAATYVISIGGDFGDTGKIAIVILADDQVVVTSVVDPSITFSLSANSTDFGSLPVGSVDTSSPNITLTIGTNANNGYTITVYDQGSGANPGLYNSVAAKIIGSADVAYGDIVTLVGGTEGYGLQASSAGATIGDRFDGAGDEVGGLELNGAAPTLASYASQMAANHTITVVHKAAIGAWTTAGAYTDTITYIATGNF